MQIQKKIIDVSKVTVIKMIIRQKTLQWPKGRAWNSVLLCTGSNTTIDNNIDLSEEVPFKLT